MRKLLLLHHSSTNGYYIKSFLSKTIYYTILQGSFAYNDIQCPHFAKKASTYAYVALPLNSDNLSS